MGYNAFQRYVVVQGQHQDLHATHPWCHAGPPPAWCSLQPAQRLLRVRRSLAERHEERRISSIGKRYAICGLGGASLRLSWGSGLTPRRTKSEG